MRLFALLMVVSVAAFAQGPTYQMQPDGQGGYTLQPIAPLPEFSAPTFDAGIQQLRALEGIDPAATAQIMQDPANPVPAQLCSFPDGSISTCVANQVTVR